MYFLILELSNEVALTVRSSLHEVKPIEFDLSFTGPETAPFGPRGQKPRVDSLEMNPCSHFSEYCPVPCRLEMRGVNGEIAGEREQKGKEKASVPTWERRLDNRVYSLMSLVALP